MYVFLAFTHLKQVHTHLWNVHALASWDHVIEGMHVNSISLMEAQSSHVNVWLQLPNTAFTTHLCQNTHTSPNGLGPFVNIQTQPYQWGISVFLKRYCSGPNPKSCCPWPLSAVGRNKNKKIWYSIDWIAKWQHKGYGQGNNFSLPRSLPVCKFIYVVQNFPVLQNVVLFHPDSAPWSLTGLWIAMYYN